MDRPVKQNLGFDIYHISAANILTKEHFRANVSQNFKLGLQTRSFTTNNDHRGIWWYWVGSYEGERGKTKVKIGI